MKLSTPDKGWAWVFLAAAFFCSIFVIGMVTGSTGILFFAIRTKLELSREQAAWPFTLRKFTGAFSALLTGFLSHFVSLKNLALIGISISVIGLASCYVLNGILAITIQFGVLLGLGVGMVNTVNTIMVNRYFKKYRTVAVGITYSGIATGEFLFPLITSYLLDVFGVQGCFLLLSGSLMQAFVSVSLYRNPPPIYQSSTSSDRIKVSTVLLSFLSLFSSVMFHVIWITVAVYSITYTTYITIVVDYAVECGIQKTTAIFIPSTVSITVFCGRLCCGWLIDMGWMKRKTMMFIAFFFLSAAYATIPMWTSQIGLFATAVLIGLTVSLLSINVSPLYTDYLGLKNLPLGLGTGKALNGILHLSSPSVLGYFRDTKGNYESMFFYFAGFCMFACLLWLLVSVITKVERLHRFYEL